MKKVIFTSLVFFLLCTTSCNNDETMSNKSDETEFETELFSVTSVTTKNYSNVSSLIEKWENKSKNTGIKSSNKEEPEDLSIINVSYLPDTEIIFGKSDIEEYQYIAYLIDKNGIYNQFYMNVVEDDTFYNLNYYPVDNEPFSFKINKFDGTLIKPQITKASAGQRTMDCIDDAYSNHGWVSVWLTIQSIAIPWTGVAIAAACAGQNIR